MQDGRSQYNSRYHLLFNQKASDGILISDLKGEKKFFIKFLKEKCNYTYTEARDLRFDCKPLLQNQVTNVETATSLALNFTSEKESAKPLVVYYRHSIPMLYDGPSNEEIMLDTFVQNQQANVNTLNDDSFEHLTQAASGATTGDWFVMFYRDDCELCMRFRAKWEYIASQLKGRINLAQVNVMSDGISTGSRFGVEQIPTFLFFRQGKIYHYDLPNVESKAFQDFALGWYKNTPSKPVPVPKTPFDELVDRVVFTLKENPLILPGAGVALILVLIAVALSAWKSGSRRSEKTTSSKTKKSAKKAN
nr:EOG090X0856 [Eurycercus lamellatus]